MEKVTDILLVDSRNKFDRQDWADGEFIASVRTSAYYLVKGNTSEDIMYLTRTLIFRWINI